MTQSNTNDNPFYRPVTPADPATSSSPLSDTGALVTPPRPADSVFTTSPVNDDTAVTPTDTSVNSSPVTGQSEPIASIDNSLPIESTVTPIQSAQSITGTPVIDTPVSDTPISNVTDQTIPNSFPPINEVQPIMSAPVTSTSVESNIPTFPVTQSTPPVAEAVLPEVTTSINTEPTTTIPTTETNQSETIPSVVDEVKPIEIPTINVETQNTIADTSSMQPVGSEVSMITPSPVTPITPQIPVQPETPPVEEVVISNTSFTDTLPAIPTTASGDVPSPVQEPPVTQESPKVETSEAVSVPAEPVIVEKPESNEPATSLLDTSKTDEVKEIKSEPSVKAPSDNKMKSLLVLLGVLVVGIIALVLGIVLASGQ